MSSKNKYYEKGSLKEEDTINHSSISFKTEKALKDTKRQYRAARDRKRNGNV